MSRSRIALLLLGAAALAPAVIAAAQTPLETAKSLFDAGRYTDAQAVLRAEIAKSANQPVLYYWLARSSFELRQNDQAVNDAERAVELEPKNSEFHHFLATASGYKAEGSGWFSGLSLARKAQREFFEAVQLDPSNIPAQRDLINFYIAAPGIAGGGEDKAEDQIKKLEAIDSVQAHLARLSLYHNQKKWNQAVEEANAVIAARPKEAAPYLEIADYYVGREGFAGMRTALGAIPSTAAHQRRTDYYRGVADVIAGDNAQEAESLLKAYIAGGPVRREDRASLAAAHTWLGRLFEKIGRRTEAMAEYRSAADLDPKDKIAREGLKRVGG
ncbi:MAG TPA: tetratricopeptide repeat protein [Candidatus Acidoferrales bacterium]|nr:tetratricopeptide repeat protein [Candidatus Acidoferrales bacterium]